MSRACHGTISWEHLNPECLPVPKAKLWLLSRALKLEDKPYASCIAGYRTHAYKPSAMRGNARQIACGISK